MEVFVDITPTVIDCGHTSLLHTSYSIRSSGLDVLERKDTKKLLTQTETYAQK